MQSSWIILRREKKKDFLLAKRKTSRFLLLIWQQPWQQWKEEWSDETDLVVDSIWSCKRGENISEACSFATLEIFDTFGNIAHTYAVHGDGAAFNVETHDNGGGVNQNICNLGVMRDRRPVKAEEQVIDDWSIPAWTEREKEISHGDVRAMT